MVQDASLPALTLYDAPRLPFRGLMVQLDRRIVDVAFLLRINKLLVYLDSFGGPTLFPFESYPIGGKKPITKPVSGPLGQTEVAITKVLHVREKLRCPYCQTTFVIRGSRIQKVG